MWITLVFTIIRYAGPYILVFCLGFWSHWKLDNWWSGGSDDAHTVAETVLKVNSANEFVISGGIFGMRKRLLTLYGLEIPSQVSEQAKDSVSALISDGDRIEVEVVIGKNKYGSVSGLVFSPSGVNVGLALLKAGLAKNVCERKDFKTAEASAIKNKLGIWKSERLRETMKQELQSAINELE